MYLDAFPAFAANAIYTSTRDGGEVPLFYRNRTSFPTLTVSLLCVHNVCKTVVKKFVFLQFVFFKRIQQPRSI